MLKSELVARLAAANPHIYQRDAEAIVATILDTLTDALVRGDRVELRGFCTLAVRRLRARTGRNPRTGQPVAIAEKTSICCKTGRDMVRRLNGPGPA